MPPVAVTFDYGQTLADLDTRMLAERAAERGLRVDPARLDAGLAAAWRAYAESIGDPAAGHPWKRFMIELLLGAGAARAMAGPVTEWLWDQQPTRNLWRRPVPGMIELARELATAGVRVGVISNSEGRLADLIAELGWSDVFKVVADSGRLGVEKPDPRIFRWTAQRLGVEPADVTHVGDVWAADIEGALAAGMSAIWLRRPESTPPPAGMPPGVRVCHDPGCVRRALL